MQSIKSKDLSDKLVSLTPENRDDVLRDVKDLLLNKDLTYKNYRIVWKGFFYALWASDKIKNQVALAEELAKFIYFMARNKLDFFLWTRACFNIIGREWNKIDYYRINKFMKLTRFVVIYLIKFYVERQWNPKVMEQFGQIIQEEIFPYEDYQKLNGLRMYYVKIFAEELAQVQKINTEQFKTVINPLINILKVHSCQQIREEIITHIFQKLAELKYEKFFKRVDFTSVYNDLFEIASKEESIQEGNRKSIYDVIDIFNDLKQALEGENEEDEEEVDENDEKIQNQNNQAEDGSEKKKKKKKKNKNKRKRSQEINENEEDKGEIQKEVEELESKNTVLKKGKLEKQQEKIVQTKQQQNEKSQKIKDKNSQQLKQASSEKQLISQVNGKSAKKAQQEVDFEEEEEEEDCEEEDFDEEDEEEEEEDGEGNDDFKEFEKLMKKQESNVPETKKESAKQKSDLIKLMKKDFNNIQADEEEENDEDWIDEEDEDEEGENIENEEEQNENQDTDDDDDDDEDDEDDEEDDEDLVDVYDEDEEEGEGDYEDENYLDDAQEILYEQLVKQSQKGGINMQNFPLFYMMSSDKEKKKYFKELNQKYIQKIQKEKNVSKPQHSRKVNFNLNNNKTKEFDKNVEVTSVNPNGPNAPVNTKYQAKQQTHQQAHQLQQQKAKSNSSNGNNSNNKQHNNNHNNNKKSFIKKIKK